MAAFEHDRLWLHWRLQYYLFGFIQVKSLNVDVLIIYLVSFMWKSEKLESLFEKNNFVELVLSVQICKFYLRKWFGIWGLSIFMLGDAWHISINHSWLCVEMETLKVLISLLLLFFLSGVSYSLDFWIFLGVTLTR